MQTTERTLPASSPEEAPSLKENLYKYLAKWPLFLVSLAICTGVGFLYARYTLPKYMASCTFLVKDAASSSNASNDLIDEALNGKRTMNLNNEMLAISSSALMERVVIKHNFNTAYYKIGKVLTIEIYVDAPFRLLVQDLKDSLPVTLTLQKMTGLGGSGFIGTQKNGEPFSFKWYMPFKVAGKTCILTHGGQSIAANDNFMVTWRPVGAVAAELSAGLSISPFDNRTSAIEMSMKAENLQKGKDILNAVFTEFNLSDIEDRTRISENTLQFIDYRLGLMSGELQNVEGNLEDYQGSKNIVDLKGQTAQSLSNTNEMSKNIKDISVQNGVASMILEYFQNPSNKNKLVPSSLGINDATLTSLISQYNELQLKKDREAPSLAPNSTVMEDINSQLDNLRNSILESLNNIIKNFHFRQNNFDQQNGQNNQFLSSVPHKERALLEIKRKQSITEGLYLYLLQKREEAAISGTGSTVSHFKQVDLAKGYGPVEPNSSKALTIAMILGLLLPFIFIYLKKLLNDKVLAYDDLSRKLKAQVFGEISHVAKQKKLPIAVTKNDIVREQFKTVRTNLSFILKNPNSKSILITSSSANAGKSFVSLNLAAVCASRGKKCALLEFDIKKPEFASALNLTHNQGIIQWLLGETDNLNDICHSINSLPGLDIYPCGSIPLNSEDLLLTDKLNNLFKALQAQYDYIIIDSPPAGMVSDAFILQQYSNLVLYIVRCRVTSKKDLAFINEIERTEKMSNVRLLLNDVASGGKYGYYKNSYGN